MNFACQRTTGACAEAICALLALTLTVGCGDADGEPAPKSFVAVTFNTGTTQGLPSPQAGYSDQYYGHGLAWRELVEVTRAFFAELQPDVVGFQEIFHSEECATVPPEAKPGFVCETWQPGDPTVAQVVVGAGYQVACHLGKPDKCLAVRRAFGTFRGCSGDLCLDGLAGAAVPGCGSGARIGRAVVDLAGGGEITVVNVHGSSGLAQADQDCRVLQMAQVFVELGLGDGPAANGDRNLVLGDFNTDPARHVDFDESAAFVAQHVGPGEKFHFVTDVGPDVPATYGGFFNIDHVISDAFTGRCWAPGVTDGHPPLTETAYFDHKPQVCTLR